MGFITQSIETKISNRVQRKMAEKCSIFIDGVQYAVTAEVTKIIVPRIELGLNQHINNRVCEVRPLRRLFFRLQSCSNARTVVIV